jgi:hypothetical protein
VVDYLEESEACVGRRAELSMPGHRHLGARIGWEWSLAV